MDIKTIRLFSDSSEIEPLEGGQGLSIRAGNVVLKPVEDIEKYIWIAETLSKIDSKNIKIAKPVKSNKNSWVENQVGATKFIEGNFYEGRLIEKLKACRSLNRTLESVQRPITLKKWKSPWISASKVAWNNENIPSDCPFEVKQCVCKLIDQLAPLELENQLIHSDLAANILFNINDQAIIIDFSPDFKPAIYSEILLIVDSIAWHKESTEALRLIPSSVEGRNQLLLRAVLFRLCVPLFFDSQNLKMFYDTFNEFKPILDMEKLMK